MGVWENAAQEAGLSVEAVTAASQLPVDQLTANFAEETAKLTVEEQDAVISAAATAITDPDVESAIRATVAKLSDDVRTVNSSMFSVRVTLTTLSNQFTDDETNRNIVKGFLGTFAQYQAKWQQVLNASKNNASTLGSYANQTANLLFPTIVDADISLDNKKELLTTFVNQAQAQKTQAAATAELFKTLSQDFVDFRAEVLNWADGLEEKIQEDIVQKKQQILSLETELSRLNAALAAMVTVVGLGATAAATGAGVILASAGAAAPAAIWLLVGGLISAALAGISAMGIAIAISAKTASLENRKRELAELESKLESVKKTVADAATIGDSLLTAATVINGFSDTWDQTVQFIQGILDDYNGAKQAETEAMLREKLQDAKNTWMTIGKLMDFYVADLFVTTT